MKRPSKCPNCGIERDCVTCKHDGEDFLDPQSHCSRCLDSCGRMVGYECTCNNTPVTGSIHPEPKFDFDEMLKSKAAIDETIELNADMLARLGGVDFELDHAMPDTGFKIVCGSGLYDKIMRRSDNGGVATKGEA